jgi:hypothetical protein
MLKGKLQRISAYGASRRVDVNLSKTGKASFAYVLASKNKSVLVRYDSLNCVI